MTGPQGLKKRRGRGRRKGGDEERREQGGRRRGTGGEEGGKMWDVLIRSQTPVLRTPLGYRRKTDVVGPTETFVKVSSSCQCLYGNLVRGSGGTKVEVIRKEWKPVEGRFGSNPSCFPLTVFLRTKHRRAPRFRRLRPRSPVLGHARQVRVTYGLETVRRPFLPKTSTSTLPTGVTMVLLGRRRRVGTDRR